ncbi:MAG: molybdopterin-dependent oxidoreductase, partial [Pseudomonadota bacterium]
MKQQPAPRVAGYCALCRSRCGAQFVVEDGRLTGVEPLADHPTGGALCAKGRAGPELQYHPARLTKPLRRTRPRSDPDPGWVEVSWDEALGDIAARLGAIRAESGAHAIAFASASPGATALSDSLEWIERLVFAFGSPNFLTGVEICNWHRDHNHAFTFGTGIGMPDYANSDLVMLWGFNPGNVWLAQAQGVAAAQARGAKLLVIDPVRTRHARQADLWLPVRPGTDAAVALGLARELIAQGRHDDDFVRRWTNAPFLIREDDGRPLTERDLLPQAAGNADGFGERERPLAWHLERGAPVALDTSEAMAPSLSMQLALAGHFVVETAAGPVACRPAMAHYMAACEPWTPQAVEAFTGVPAAQVREAARMIGDAGQRISYFSWTGIAQHANATQTDRAIALLYAITGSVDAPGGNLHLARAAAAKINDRTLLDPAQAERALGLAQRPLGPPAHGWTLGTDFHRAVVDGEPYRVRALVGFGANLLMSQPDSQAIRAALQGLEFQVHCDLFETPTARHADYLLPVQTPYEREGLRIGFEISAAAQHTVQLRPAVVAPTPGS